MTRSPRRGRQRNKTRSWVAYNGGNLESPSERSRAFARGGVQFEREGAPFVVPKRLHDLTAIYWYVLYVSLRECSYESLIANMCAPARGRDTQQARTSLYYFKNAGLGWEEPADTSAHHIHGGYSRRL